MFRSRTKPLQKRFQTAAVYRGHREFDVDPLPLSEVKLRPDPHCRQISRHRRKVRRRKIDKLQYQVGVPRGRQRPFNADRLNLASGFSQPGGIHQQHLVAAKVERDLEHVACCSSLIADDRDIPARERVQQAGLAGVRPAYDRDAKTFPDDLRLAIALRVPDLRISMAG